MITVLFPFVLTYPSCLSYHSDTEKSNENTKQKKGNATGFLKPLQLSDAFAKFLGTGETTIVRSDAVKRIWDYIKQNQLQVWCCLPELV